MGIGLPESVSGNIFIMENWKNLCLNNFFKRKVVLITCKLVHFSKTGF